MQCVLASQPLVLSSRHISECCSGALLPHCPNSVVAVGAADRRIHLYVDDARDGLQYVCWLEGHHDWVRDLSFTSDEDSSDLLLASASLDSFTRLWRISRYAHAAEKERETSSSSSVEGSEKKQRVLFALSDFEGNVPRFSAGLDALLVGHSHWVQSVRWNGGRIVTASMDKTMIIWEKDEEDGVWIDKYRLGEIGGNALGFYGAVFSPDGTMVMGHSYNGSLHLWVAKPDGGYEPRTTVSGHIRPVTDISWDRNGSYFVSSSHDQTVRLWAPWVVGEEHKGWYELARPQIHGHDVNAALMLEGRNHVFISGSEEKVLRVYSGTASFAMSLQNVSGVKAEESDMQRPFGATLPPLGLSNKPLNSAKDVAAADEARQQEAFPDEVWKAEPSVLHFPPVETQLAQSTLWVEDQKLYGHSSEVYAVACSHDGKLVASSCKGKAKPHTDVLLWNTSDWSLAGRLSSHKMTVTRIAFSHSDRFIATVSRDLQLCLWSRQESGEYVLAWEQEKAHGRIIWDVCWSPDDEYLVTCSRDKKVTSWKLDDKAATLEMSSSIKRATGLNSVAFHPKVLSNYRYLLACGSDAGVISFWVMQMGKWTLQADLPNMHGRLPVTRLAFKFVPHLQSVMLLSAGEDHSVRLTRVAATDVFAQLCALMLCVEKSCGIIIPQLLVKAIHSRLEHIQKKQ